MARTADAGAEGVVDGEGSNKCSEVTSVVKGSNMEPRRVTLEGATNTCNENGKRPPPQDDDTNILSTNKKQKPTKESFDSLFQTLQNSKNGKAVMVVEDVMKIALAHDAEGISPVGRDDAIFLAEKMISCQDQFRASGKPPHVEVGFHYTKSGNLDSIREKGILCSAGGTYGPGIYTGNNPEAFCGWAGGNVGLIVGVLKGHQVVRQNGVVGLYGPNNQVEKADADKEADTVVGNKLGHVDSSSFSDEIVLQGDSQVLPLLKFDTARMAGKDSVFRDLIWALHQQIQHKVLDKYFNDNIRTEVTRIERPIALDPQMPALQPMPGMQSVGHFSGTGNVLGGNSWESRLLAEAQFQLEPAWDSDGAQPEPALSSGFGGSTPPVPDMTGSLSSAVALPEAVLSSGAAQPEATWNSASTEPVPDAASNLSSTAALLEAVPSSDGAQPEPAWSSTNVAPPVPDTASSFSSAAALPDGVLSFGGARVAPATIGSTTQPLPMLSSGIAQDLPSVQDTGGSCTSAVPSTLLPVEQLSRIEGCIRYEEGSNDSTGKSPTGTMTVTTNNKVSCCESLDDYGIIIIEYELQSGVQKAHHPNPGFPYNGTKKYAYLPYTTIAQALLKRLKWAFSRGLTFTVGTKVSEDEHLEHRILFAIPHKSSLSGGKEKNGWPDVEYFRKCHAELDKLEVPHQNEL